MKTLFVFLVFALVGCDPHIHGVVDPNAPVDPNSISPTETRPDLTIALHATVSDNSATDGLVQLSWDITATGNPQTANSVSMTVRRGSYLGYSGDFLSMLTVPSVYHGPNNAAHLSNGIRLPVGIYTFVATIDDLNTVTESNENNNTSTITVEVLPNGAG